MSEEAEILSQRRKDAKLGIYFFVANSVFFAAGFPFPIASFFVTFVLFVVKARSFIY